MIELFKIERLQRGVILAFLVAIFFNILIDFESINKSIILSSSTFFGLFVVTLYYSFGRLKYKVENDFLILIWSDKLIFKQKEIDKIFIRDIKSLVVDNECLIEIITRNKKFRLGRCKIPILKLKNDSPRLIQNLIRENPEINIIDEIEVQLKSTFFKILLLPLIWIMLVGFTIRIVYDLLYDFSLSDIFVLIVILMLIWPSTIFITVLSFFTSNEKSDSNEE